MYKKARDHIYYVNSMLLGNSLSWKCHNVRDTLNSTYYVIIMYKKYF